MAWWGYTTNRNWALAMQKTKQEPKAVSRDDTGGEVTGWEVLGLGRAVGRARCENLWQEEA